MKFASPHCSLKDKSRLVYNLGIVNVRCNMGSIGTTCIVSYALVLYPVGFAWPHVMLSEVYLDSLKIFVINSLWLNPVIFVCQTQVRRSLHFFALNLDSTPERGRCFLVESRLFQ